jgi:hypothetical protein
MSTNATGHPWRKTLVWSAAFLAAGLSTLGFIGATGLFSAGDTAWNGASLVGVLALAAFAGLLRHAFRARADERRQAALDHYAEQELAKGTHRGGHVALRTRPYRIAHRNKPAGIQGDHPPTCDSAQPLCGFDATHGRPLADAVGCGALIS